ncbi:DUF1080 domain-containing protein [Lewinella sp. W8]|nr:DUF1080 domain-containing protein [Lewinella sp. W8]
MIRHNHLIGPTAAPNNPHFMTKFFYLIIFLLSASLSAQPWDVIALENLSSFSPTGSNWSVVGEVFLPQGKTEFKTKRGTGILLNQPTDKQRQGLQTNWEHGDMDLDVEVMLPPGSNSGIYLQGRYEVQLLDSWGKARPTFGDMGGIYQRYDEARQYGWGGMAPAMNAAKAPGLWQHLTVEFRAPRFNERGEKTADARLISVKLNGVTIHENVRLTGPTRGPIGAEEVARGPLFIQGDHGAVAFRNLRYRKYDNPPLRWKNLRWEATELSANTDREFPKNPGEVTSGTGEAITTAVTNIRERLALRYRGTLPIQSPGTYTFMLKDAGFGSLTVDGKKLIENNWGEKEVSVDLDRGDHEIELLYVKIESWVQPTLALYVSGPNQAPQPLHDPASLPASGGNPIFVDLDREPTILRSFLDLRVPNGDPFRVNHAVHVGFPEGISYTYDLRGGHPVVSWRGGFMNASQMWNGRGNATASPVGMQVFLDTLPAWSGATYAPQAAMIEADHVRPRGYQLDEAGRPVFRYALGEAEVTDVLHPLPGGKGLKREIRWEGTPATAGAWRLASGQIVANGKGRYLVDERFWIVLPDELAGSATLTPLRGDHHSLTLPANGATGSISYQIIY